MKLMVSVVLAAKYGYFVVAVGYRDVDGNRLNPRPLSKQAKLNNNNRNK